MPQRLDIASMAPAPYKAMVALDRSITLEPQLRKLLKVRASLINGCAFCIDMHWKDARAAGESEERLFMVSAWRESALYTEREKAALELCEAMTLIAEAHVPDEVWTRASSHFDTEELGELVFAITAINSWNRIAITCGAEPGHYQPRVQSA
ncbi:MAG TPA: carboxymuconolactone decarboxylase family protein [Nocardioides sp.]|nr:carboxymuconolactone decarboxylase family protein [Nocardioides sp.]